MSANGKLKPYELTSIAGGGQLRDDAAEAWNAFSRFCKEKHGRNVGVNDSYRPLGRPGDLSRGVWSQNAAWEKYKSGGNLAAVPGTSNHGLGIAIDADTPTQNLIANYGEQFGWAKKWSDASSEPWHFKWRSGNYSAVVKWHADPTLTRASKGPEVHMLKTLLKRHGFWPYPTRSNTFGRATKSQVIKFQKAKKLTADGVVGLGTWKALRKPAVKKPKAKAPTPKPPVRPKPTLAKPKPIPKFAPTDLEQSHKKPKATKPKATKKPKANPNAKYFADIYEGDAPIDLAKYKAAGHSLIILKASEGATFQDHTFVKRFGEAGKLGLTRFVYHFARPGNGNKPDAEAKNLVDAIKKAGKLKADDRIVLDWEDPKFENKKGDVWVASFIKEVARLGYTVRVLYSGGWYLPGTLEKWPVDQNKKPLRYWHANYSSSPESNVPEIAKKNLWAVQFTDGQTGPTPHTCDGIGHCDVSYFK